MKDGFKNIQISKPVVLESLVEYQKGQIVSRTLAQNSNRSITLFSFDKGEEIAAHTANGDAFVQILSGKAEITIGEEKLLVKQGEAVVMPAGVPHALYAVEPFKMMLIVLF
jgi:quercetin dioxygenase-like cupin family protein